MKVVFSRKGVDSAAGRCASPIIDGRPISLPIPTERDGVTTTYELLGIGQEAVRAMRSPDAAVRTCHEDPMFGDGICAFGQVGTAQSHLANQGVGPGDVFLFFGLSLTQMVEIVTTAFLHTWKFLKLSSLGPNRG